MTYMLAYHDISHHKSAIIFTPYPRLPRYWCSGQPRRLLRDRTPRLTSPRGSGRLSWEGIAVFEEPNRTIVGVKAPSSVVEIPTEPVASHVRAEPSVEPCWCQLRLSPRYPSELALATHSQPQPSSHAARLETLTNHICWELRIVAYIYNTSGTAEVDGLAPQRLGLRVFEVQQFMTKLLV